MTVTTVRTVAEQRLNEVVHMEKVIRVLSRYVSSDLPDTLSDLRSTGVVVFTELEPQKSSSDRPVGYMLGGPSNLARKHHVVSPWRKRLSLSLAWLLGR